MKARTALLELFRESQEWRDFFRSCCEMGTFRLRSQTWQFRDQLGDRGNHFQTDEMEDALLGLARELLPNTSAAQWDAEWAHGLCKDTLARLAEAYLGLSAEERDALDLSAQNMWDERMYAAGRDNDPADFRAALRCWERAGLDAIHGVQVRGGAA
jgi:hypothetical protein